MNYEESAPVSPLEWVEKSCKVRFPCCYKVLDSLLVPEPVRVSFGSGLLTRVGCLVGHLSARYHRLHVHRGQSIDEGWMSRGTFISSVSPVACPSRTEFKEVTFHGFVSHSTGPQHVFVHSAQCQTEWCRHTKEIYGKSYYRLFGG